MRRASLIRSGSGWVAAVCALAMLGQSAVGQAEGGSAYLWAVRRGCQADPLLEDAVLSRIRDVGRSMIKLNVPATPETRACSGLGCAQLARQQVGCSSLTGPLLGAELDEVQAPAGVVTRVRAWRADLEAGAAAVSSVAYELCPPERCTFKQLQDLVAKTLSQLLEQSRGSSAAARPASSSFPADACARYIDVGAAPPLWCELPMTSVCTAEEVAVEPSGRAGPGKSAAAISAGKPFKGVLWVPVLSTGLGVAATLGLGIANEHFKPVINGQETAHVLTPAFWTSAALTLAFGVGSIAVISGHHRNELRSDVAGVDACFLLVDNRVTEK